MAKKVTNADIIQINELYLKMKTYAAVARETGFAPSTVKKYVISDYIAAENINEIKFNEEIIPIELIKFSGDWNNFLKLSDEEKKEIEELKKEILT